MTNKMVRTVHYCDQ